MDEEGLLVGIIFKAKQGKLIVQEGVTNVIISAFSGLGTCRNNPSESCQKQKKGIVPFGTYDILERAGKRNFYRLEAIDSNYGDDVKSPENRSLLRLHYGSESWGCITIKKWSEWIKLKNLIENTSKTNSYVESKSFWNPFPEKLIKYGILSVVP